MGDEYGIVEKKETWLSIQTEAALPLEAVNSQLLVLQTAFPTVMRNYDQHEFQALQSLWYDIFKNVPELLMKEAVKRFIINDRKGFFPSPGQIIGYIEQIVKEYREEEEQRKLIEEIKRCNKYERLVEAGENCANCYFCKLVSEEILKCNGTTFFESKMYCTNESSINYKERRGFGVSENLRCEFFSWDKVAIKLEE